MNPHRTSFGLSSPVEFAASITGCRWVSAWSSREGDTHWCVTHGTPWPCEAVERLAVRIEARDEAIRLGVTVNE